MFTNLPVPPYLLWRAALLLQLVLTGCGQQDPAFTDTLAEAEADLEEMQAEDADAVAAQGLPSEAVTQSADATAGGDPNRWPGGDDGAVANADPLPDVAGDLVASLPGTPNPLPAADLGADNDANQVAAAPSPPPTQAEKKVAAKQKDRYFSDQPGGNEPPIDFRFYTVAVDQAEAPAVDILWIIDSSGSMREEQDYLAANFQSFIEGLSDDGADFQTAVTSTDVCDDEIPEKLKDRVCPIVYGGNASTRHRGSFIGGDDGVLAHDHPTLAATFAEYTKVGIYGSGFEHGLYAAHLAVKKTLGGTNAPLLRDDAFLSIIVVSDEEDDGIGLGMKDAYHGYNFFEMGMTEFRYAPEDLIQDLTEKRAKGRFAVSTITGVRDEAGEMCSSPHSKPLEEGTAYIKAATDTGGIVQSICDTNWADSLGNLGRDLKAQVSQIPLEKNAFVPSITVTVDGAATDDWDFIAANNAIRFDTDAIPPPGARIVVEYFGLP